MVSIGIVEISEKGEPEPVAEDLRMALQELLRKAELNGDVDFLREGVRVLAQEVMEIEVAQHLGAERYERASDRSSWRAQWLSRSDLGHACGQHRTAGSACAGRWLLSGSPRAAAAW